MYKSRGLEAQQLSFLIAFDLQITDYRFTESRHYLKINYENGLLQNVWGNIKG